MLFAQPSTSCRLWGLPYIRYYRGWDSCFLYLDYSVDPLCLGNAQACVLIWLNTKCSTRITYASTCLCYVKVQTNFANLTHLNSIWQQCHWQDIVSLTFLFVLANNGCFHLWLDWNFHIIICFIFCNYIADAGNWIFICCS